MSELLLITDDPRRGERLAQDLGTFRACRIHDLYAEALGTGTPALIVSDVSTLTSDAVLRLRRILGRVRGDGVPYLFLVHGNAARAEAQAQALGATGTLGFGVAAQTLLAALEGLHRCEDPSAPAVERHAGAAQRLLADVFVPGVLVTPAAIETGTGLVTRAIREAGVRAWIQAVRRFDNATHQHCLLVAGLAAAFASSLGFAAADRHRLTKAALLHDVGKIRVPPAILNKPGQLDAVELSVMRTHPVLGHAMLLGCGFEDAMLTVVRSHHEMLDGSGYPDALLGGQIPDLVRLVTVCDVYGALIERRPYRAPMAGKQAFSILDGMVGRLDGDLVRAFQPIAAAFDPSMRAAAHDRAAHAAHIR
ncbi:HD domain-containing protein [Methylobacterium sp. J-026]|uniref:HD-GYP domain-containing protein n=1 Tax=Methylobacterium sp. J-026 TaxID=2836624 RepID=UPI001FBB4A92|nr:HD domain-containing phosphohydrolase [Methylobacterium sp. J-026]MCJ2134139.1 HD domain-containing protein [Methylobacterium sp. J-026]